MAFGNNQTRETTFDKKDVIARLTKNREGHREKVEKAWTKYNELVVEELAKRLDQAKNGQPVEPEFLQHLPIPLDYTSEYDAVLDWLEIQQGNTVKLTDREFVSWMRDKWDWMDHFKMSNSTYNVS